MNLATKLAEFLFVEPSRELPTKWYRKVAATFLEAVQRKRDVLVSY